MNDVKGVSDSCQSFERLLALAKKSIRAKLGMSFALKDFMAAKQLNIAHHFTIGRVYRLEDVKPLAASFKLVTTRKATGGLVHLYRQKNTCFFWMSGSFRKPDCIEFIYLGPRQTKSQLHRFLMQEFKSILREWIQASTDALLSAHTETYLRVNYGVWDLTLDSWKD